MAKRTDRIQISLSPDELQVIDDWQFENRIPSRAAAVRELVGRSVAFESVEERRTVASQSIGVVESALSREGPTSVTIADARAPDMPLVYVSDGFCELCEYDREEVIGRNCRFLQGERTSRAKTKLIAEALEKGEAITVDLVNHRKSGAPYEIRLEIEPVRLHDSVGGPSLFVGTQTFIRDL